MDIQLVCTIIGFIITITGIHYKQENRINLLVQKVDSNKTSTDESINRLIKSIDKLELSIERLTDRMNDKH